MLLAVWFAAFSLSQNSSLLYCLRQTGYVEVVRKIDGEEGGEESRSPLWSCPLPATKGPSVILCFSGTSQVVSEL